MLDNLSGVLPLPKGEGRGEGNGIGLMRKALDAGTVTSPSPLPSPSGRGNPAVSLVRGLVIYAPEGSPPSSSPLGPACEASFLVPPRTSEMINCSGGAVARPGSVVTKFSDLFAGTRRNSSAAGRPSRLRRPKYSRKSVVVP